MPTVKGLLLDHLEYTFAREGWHPPLAHAVAGLTAAQARWKPDPERHSIWQIVRHLLLWKRGVLRAWDGDPPAFAELAQSDWAEAGGDQGAWEADVRALHEVYAEILRRLQRIGDAELDETRPWYRGGQPGALGNRLLHMLTHDVYHAGQIQYLRALQHLPADRLFSAAYEGRVEVVAEVLRDHPEVVNAYNPDGWTALQMAAHTGALEVVRVLLDRGADVSAVSRNDDRTTALASAEKAGYGDVAALLRRHGAD